MYTSDDPCPYWMYIYRKEDVDLAIRYNPEITWFDFDGGWDELHKCKRDFVSESDYEYWFCVECKRVYIVSRHHYRWIKIYHRVNSALEKPVDATWSDIFAFHDEELFDPIENAVGDLQLKDFIYGMEHPYTFKMSPDKKVIVAYKTGTTEFCFAYVLEESWDSAASD